jgi:hypothetical protein
MVLSYRDKLDEKFFKVSSPSRNEETKTWDMDFLYDSKPFMFLTPRIKLSKDTGQLIFNINSKIEFVNFIEEVQYNIIKYISSNSKNLFNGKEFSEDKLIDCLKQTWDIDDMGVGHFDTINEDLSKVRCTDPFNNQIEYAKISQDVSAIVSAKNISFTKNLFTINYEIKHLKMTKPEKSKNLKNFFDEIDLDSKERDQDSKERDQDSKERDQDSKERDQDSKERDQDSKERDQDFF